MKKGIAITIAAVLVLVLIFVFGPVNRGLWNRYRYNVQKVDDATDYDTLKNVEDSCRAMIASYEADKLIFEQYKDSDSEEKRSWGEQAKIRANRTAATYNEYIRKNSYVWRNAIPADIDEKLEYID